jgi:diacylglycerol kinase family enzyme
LIAILFNPIAGSGHAHIAAEEMKRGLESDGADVVLIATERAAAKLWLRPRLAGVSTLVIAGGDGAVRAAAAEAAAAGVPIWHAPSGTENLFAKSFGMTRDPRAIARAIRRGRVQHIDLGYASCDRGDGGDRGDRGGGGDRGDRGDGGSGGDRGDGGGDRGDGGDATAAEAFTLMASIGFDADVVHALSARRRGGITHASYLPPIWEAFYSWRPAHLAWTIHGEREELGRGVVIAANLPAYGLKLNPAADATADDGLLDCVFIPARAAVELLPWIVLLRTGLHRGCRPIRIRRAAAVVLHADPPQRFQLDGDAAGAGQVQSEVRIETRPRALAILLPVVGA